MAKIAVLKHVRRVWAVGSIRGQAPALGRIHRAIGELFSPGDRLIYLGGFLGEGDAILAMMDEMLAFRREIMARPHVFARDILYLRGQWEEMAHKMLQLHFAPNPKEILPWLIAHGMDPVIRAYGGNGEQGMIAARGGAVALTRWTGTLRAAMQARPGHWQLLGGLLHAAASDQLLFVHAGLDPARPITTQGDILWWGNCRALAGRPYEQYRRIVYGYDSEARRSADDQQLALFQSQAARPPADYALSLDGGAGIRAACFDAEGNVLHWLEEV